MNATSNRWQVALRIFISVLLLALSVLLSSNFVSAQTDSKSTPQPGTTYVIQPDDTLARIAAYAYDDGNLYEALCTYNQLEDCHHIIPGTELTIPLLEDLDIPPTPTPTLTPTPTESPAADDDTASGRTTDSPEETSQVVIPPELVDALYVVQEGDTLENIASAKYNNPSLAGRLCAFNMIPDCSVLETGSRIFTPELDILLFGEAQNYLPPSSSVVETVEPTPVPAPETETPPVETEATTEGPVSTPVPSPTATLGPSVTDTEPQPTVPVPLPTPQIPGNLSIAGHLDQDPRLEIYAYALTLSTLGDLLTQTGPYTLLAPSDSAWVQANTSTIRNLLVSAEVLTQALRSHIVQGDLSYDELANLDSVTSISGVVWPVSRAPNGDLLVGNARISGTSSTPTNGTIHILSTLIFP